MASHALPPREASFARLDKHDTDRAQECLDSLVAQWAAISVPLSLMLNGEQPLLPPCKDELADLENELRALEEGLEEEGEALEELQAALSAAGNVNPKEAYIKLKMALQNAHTKSRTPTPAPAPTSTPVPAPRAPLLPCAALHTAVPPITTSTDRDSCVR